MLNAFWSATFEVLPHHKYIIKSDNNNVFKVPEIKKWRLSSILLSYQRRISSAVHGCK